MTPARPTPPASHTPTSTTAPAGTARSGAGATPQQAPARASAAGSGGTPTPGAVTVARVDTTRSWRRVTVDAAGKGWFRLADRLADPPGLDAWYAAELAGTGRGHRDLAGALIVYRFAGSLAELVVGPLLEQRRIVLLTPENLSLRLGDNARIEALSVTAPVVAVLPDDPDAAHPATIVVGATCTPGAPDPAGTAGAAGGAAGAAGASGTAGAGTTGATGPAGSSGTTGAAAAGAGDVADPGVVGEEALAALRAVAVEGMLAVFEPLAEAVRARAPFGVRGMWGTLADHLSDVALRRARDRGSDPEGAWATAAALIDDLAARQPLLRARPTRHDVACPAGEAVFSTKGTCCLIYKTNMPLGRSSGAGAGAGAQPWIDADACTSCPLRSEGDRTRRLVRYLTDRAGAG